MGGSNPSITKPSMNSLKLNIKDANNFDIEQKITNFFVSPLPSHGLLVINSISSSSLETGNSNVEVTLDLDLPN